ncbi:TetR/AcrR family transcriptional regulator [bacterium]|nr:TetR/AcrR family transcriptional regulator [bacterium]
MRKKDPEKQEAILHSAVRIFAHQGYHVAKMSKIAEDAGVAAGSLYLYFKNKESLLEEVIDATWEDMRRRYEHSIQAEGLSPAQKLVALIDIVFDLFMDDPDRAIIFVNEQHHLEQKGIVDFSTKKEMLLNLGAQVIQEGVSRGDFDPHIDIMIFKEFIFGGLHQVLNLWALQPEQVDLDKIRKALKPIILNSIAK